MKISTILFFLCSLVAFSQEDVHNFGDLKIHDNGRLGFHGDIINDGNFNENLGLVGFYNLTSSTIYGTSRPIFYNMEVLVPDGLFLETGVRITNDLNFISGNIITPVTDTSISLNFNTDAFYFGEGNTTMIAGYASFLGKSNFTYPVGYNNRIRPLEIVSENEIANSKCAYFYENPNNPSTFGSSFNTAVSDGILNSVSNHEFWVIKGESSSYITLNWDNQSYISQLIGSLENLRIVGWKTDENRWIDLGNQISSGDFSAGSITSNLFIPDEYSIVTFGETLELGVLSTHNIKLDNYFLTPNGDGINDRLVFDDMLNTENKIVEIYNRYGLRVFEKNGYTDEFDGISNNSLTISRDKMLPSGVYFYLVKLPESGLTYQGYLYLVSKN